MRKIITYLAAITLLTGCSINQETPIAKVDGAKLLKDEVNIDSFMGMPDSLRSNALINYVNDWVDKELLFQEAERRKLELPAYLEAELKRLRKTMLVNIMIKEQVKQIVSVSDQEVRKFYNDHMSDFTAPENYYKFQSIKTSDRAVERAISGEITDGNSITDIYEKHPERSEIISMGLNFLASSTLKPEMSTQIIRQINNKNFVRSTTGGTYYWIKLIETITNGSPLPFEMVANDIRNRVLLEKQKTKYNELVDRLRSNFEFEINIDALFEEVENRQ